ncbi:MAG: tyrosine-type recombinase/integrase [Candidatus Sedimenticola sp. (ex Thyasira tokunagai)]
MERKELQTPNQAKRYFYDSSVKAVERTVDTSSNTWSIGTTHGAYIRFDECGCKNEELLDQIKYIFARKYLPSYAVDTVAAAWSAIKAMLVELEDEIELDSSGDDLLEEFSDVILVYIDTNRRDGNEGRLNTIRQFYGFGCELQLPLFDKDIWHALKKLRFSGSEKGPDVRIHIPKRSPLNANQLMKLRDLLRKYEKVFEEDSYAYATLAMVWVFIALGVRPRQLVLLFSSDLVKNIEENGRKVYLLNVPSVKRRNARPRSYFKLRPIPVFLGEMLENIVKNNRERFACQSIAFDVDTLPLFPVDPSNPRYKEGSRISKYKHVQGALNVNLRIKRLIKKIDAEEKSKGKSGWSFHVTPRRLRKTFATHAAECGCEPMLLMDLLDHSDLQHVMIYYKLGAGFAVKLQKVYEDSFGDFLQYFEGTIALDELVSRNRSSEVYGPDSLRTLLRIGYCSKNTVCTLAPPYSCYVCRKFEACSDSGVHSEVLNAMRAEAIELFDQQYSGMQYVKHISACEELVALLEKQSMNGAPV